MISKTENIHEWKEPEKLRAYKVSQQIKSAKRFVIRMLLITVPVIIFLYALFKINTPAGTDINWEKIFLTVLVCCLSLPFMIFLEPLTTRYSKRSLAISDKAINLNNFLMRWKRIKGYWIDGHEYPAELKFVKILYGNRTFSFVLPEDESARDIIKTIEHKIPYIDILDRPEIIKLTKKQTLYFSILSFVYSLLASFLLVKAHNLVFSAVLICLTFYFGPGTIGCFYVFGRKLFKNHSLKQSAILFNAISLIVIMFFSVLFLFDYLFRQIQP